jgi:cytochrome c2
MKTAIFLASVLSIVGCSRQDEQLAESITGGNVARGHRAFRQRGCGSCHEIEGDFTTQGHVGPDLHEFALQSYLPGGLVNKPDMLVRWIRFPRHVVPSTAMPELGVGEREARDLAAYLYTLR